MGDAVHWSPGPPRRQENGRGGNDGANLADILERVLDKGIVIAGDIQVNLLDIELLTIKVRLVVASVDRAKEMGIDWWERDPTLSAGRAELEEENNELRARVTALERALGGELESGDGDPEYDDERRDDGADDDPPEDDRPDDDRSDAEPADADDGGPRRRPAQRRSRSEGRARRAPQEDRAARGTRGRRG